MLYFFYLRRRQGGEFVRKYWNLICLVLLLAGCSTGEKNTTGSSITTLTRSATPPNYGNTFDTAAEEYAFATYGNLEDYTLQLDEILWEMDRLNREITLAMLEEDWDMDNLKTLMRSMEQVLLRGDMLVAPKNLQQIHEEFASSALDMAELYGTVAYLLGEELAFAKLNALLAEVSVKTAHFSQVATVLIQAIV